VLVELSRMHLEPGARPRGARARVVEPGPLVRVLGELDDVRAATEAERAVGVVLCRAARVEPVERLAKARTARLRARARAQRSARCWRVQRIA
jgi:hypothetical protein